jgi:two-component system, cell cycle sensor histidine kinase and response regulator CckA
MGQDPKPPKKISDSQKISEVGRPASAPAIQELSPQEITALVQELQVCRGEWEKQNEALRQTQASLEEARQKYRDFFDFAPVGFLTLDESGRIREVNLTALSQLQATRSILIDQPFWLLIAAEDRDPFHLHLQKIFSEPGPQHCEIRLQRQNGEVFFTRLDSVAVTDVSGARLCRVSITDISDVKQAEQRQHESERLFTAFMNHLPSVAVIRDLEGRYLFVNETVLQAFSNTREEWLGKTVDDLWPPEVAEKFKAQDRLALETKKPLRAMETLRHAHGLRHYLYYTFPIIDPEGSPVMIGTNAVDVTEHLETQTHLERLLASSPVAIYTCAPGGDYPLNYMSENVKALTGWEAQNFLDDASFWVNHLHPEDRPVILKKLASSWPQDHQGLEYRFLAKDGAYRWMHDELKLVGDKDGNPVEITGVWMDITERKQIELELEEAHNRLQTLIQALPLATISLDREGRVIGWNPAAEKIFGWKQSEVLGRPHPIIPPGQENAYKQLLAQHLAGESFEALTLKRRRRDGALLDIRLFSAPLHDSRGEIVGAMAVMEDITEAMQVREALRESEAKFRLTFDQAPIGASIASLDFRFQQVNAELCRITGYSAAELISRTFLDITHPDDRADSVTQAEKLARGDIDQYQLDKRYMRKDGEVAWVRLSVRLAKDAGGAPLYYLAMMEDITARKTLEAQLLQAQKMEAVGRLAGGVAHDFNNLLMTIMGYSELIRSSLVKDDPLHKYSGDILKATERAASLTQQLLTFSRQQMVQPQVLDLNRVIADLEKMLRRLIGEHIELSIMAGPDLGAVKADPGQINQIIMNLALNARDAMPKGGLLTLKTANVDFAARHTCRFDLVPPGRYVALSVRDTGSGMDSETLDHIFEPFFTTKETGKGTGLGLPMVYGIVKQNQGCIEVDSRPREGTIFTIYLPRLAAAVKPAGTTATPAAKLEGSETILLVEDEDGLRTLLCRFFRLFGYNVIEARHGGEALLLCERHQGPIHLMVTDVVMPQMSGKELADRLAPLHPEMSVFFMSGYTDSDLSSYGAPESPQHFISKPFRPMDLVKKVRDFLDAAHRSPAAAP